jgi:hypothetical protein
MIYQMPENCKGRLVVFLIGTIVSKKYKGIAIYKK